MGTMNEKTTTVLTNSLATQRSLIYAIYRNKVDDAGSNKFVFTKLIVSEQNHIAGI